MGKGYPAVRNRTNCVNLQNYGKNESDEELGNTECVFRYMMRCLSTPGSPIYILPVAQSISVIPVSLYAPRRFPPAKLVSNGFSRHNGG
jgi:hypothetical protein